MTNRSVFFMQTLIPSTSTYNEGPFRVTPMSKLLRAKLTGNLIDGYTTVTVSGLQVQNNFTYSLQWAGHGTSPQDPISGANSVLFLAYRQIDIGNVWDTFDNAIASIELATLVPIDLEFNGQFPLGNDIDFYVSIANPFSTGSRAGISATLEITYLLSWSMIVFVIPPDMFHVKRYNRTYRALIPPHQGAHEGEPARTWGPSVRPRPSGFRVYLRIIGIWQLNRSSPSAYVPLAGRLLFLVPPPGSTSVSQPTVSTSHFPASPSCLPARLKRSGLRYYRSSPPRSLHYLNEPPRRNPFNPVAVRAAQLAKEALKPR